MDEEKISKMVEFADLVTALCYMFFPILIWISILRYPNLRDMPRRVLLLAALMTCFVFLCGCEHLMLYAELGGTTGRCIISNMTACVSVMTVLYMIPMIPNLMSSLNQQMLDVQKLNDSVLYTKRQMLAISLFSAHEMRNPLCACKSTLQRCQEAPPGTDLTEAFKYMETALELMNRLSHDMLEASCNEDLLNQRMMDNQDNSNSNSNNPNNTSSAQLLLGCIQRSDTDYSDLANVTPVFSLRETLDSCVSTFRHFAKGMQSVTVDMTDTVPEIVQGYPGHMLQVLYNIGRNAVENTKQGHIHFAFSTEDYLRALRKDHVTSPPAANGNNKSKQSKRRRGHRVDDCQLDEMEQGALLEGESSHSEQSKEATITVLKIQISDTGPGMGSDRLKTLFRPLSIARVAQFKRRDGVGLSITSSLVELMGGTIHVQSGLGAGSTFTVYLPVRGRMTPETNLPSNSILRTDQHVHHQHRDHRHNEQADTIIERTKMMGEHSCNMDTIREESPVFASTTKVISSSSSASSEPLHVS